MSKSDNGADKPHDPTPKRIEDARKKGDIPNSRELTALTSLGTIALVVSTVGAASAGTIGTALVPFWDRLDGFDLESGPSASAMLMRTAVIAAGALVLPFAALAAAGLGSALLQGARPARKRVTPDPSRLSPVKGLSRLFGAQGWAEFAKSALKIGGIGAVAAWATWSRLPPMLALMDAPVDAVVGAMHERLASAAMLIAVLLLPIALLDLAWTRHRWRQKLRMSHDEMREEMKGSEGDPIVKGRRATLRRERARHSMIRSVDKASFVIANPTHVAVALRYDRTRDAAPIVVAKGRDRVALRIRERAEAAGVPVIEDRSLARALEPQVQCDRVIPAEFFATVAAIVRHLDSVGGGLR